MTALPPDPLRDFDHRSVEQQEADRAGLEERYAEAEAHHERTQQGLREAQQRLVDALDRDGEDEDREIGR